LVVGTGAPLVKSSPAALPKRHCKLMLPSQIRLLCAWAASGQATASRPNRQRLKDRLSQREGSQLHRPDGTCRGGSDRARGACKACRMSNMKPFPHKAICGTDGQLGEPIYHLRN